LLKPDSKNPACQTKEQKAATGGSLDPSLHQEAAEEALSWRRSQTAQEEGREVGEERRCGMNGLVGS
jgi:hypothetical protein